MSGVTSLNTLTGAVGLTSGNPFIGIGQTANNVVATFTNTGIGSFSVQGQTPPDALTTGAITLIPGAGISMATDSLANSLTITNTGGGGGGGNQITGGSGGNVGTVSINTASGDINASTTGTANAYFRANLNNGFQVNSGSGVVSLLTTDPAGLGNNIYIQTVQPTVNPSSSTASISVLSDSDLTLTSGETSGTGDISMTAGATSGNIHIKALSSTGTIAIASSGGAFDVGTATIGTTAGAGTVCQMANTASSIVLGKADGTSTPPTTGLFVDSTRLLFNNAPVGGGSGGGNWSFKGNWSPSSAYVVNDVVCLAGLATNPNKSAASIGYIATTSISASTDPPWTTQGTALGWSRLFNNAVVGFNNGVDAYDPSFTTNLSMKAISGAPTPIPTTGDNMFSVYINDADKYADFGAGRFVVAGINSGLTPTAPNTLPFITTESDLTMTINGGGTKPVNVVGAGLTVNGVPVGTGGNWSYRGLFNTTLATAYALNDVVFDTVNTAESYVCILAYTTASPFTPPSSDATNWKLFATNSTTGTASSISNGTAPNVGSVSVDTAGVVAITSADTATFLFQDTPGGRVDIGTATSAPGFAIYYVGPWTSSTAYGTGAMVNVGTTYYYSSTFHPTTDTTPPALGWSAIGGGGGSSSTITANGATVACDSPAASGSISLKTTSGSIASINLDTSATASAGVQVKTGTTLSVFDGSADGGEGGVIALTTTGTNNPTSVHIGGQSVSTGLYVGTSSLLFNNAPLGGNWNYKQIFNAIQPTAYALNDVVFDTVNTTETYICVLAYTTASPYTPPSSNTTNWKLFATNTSTSGNGAMLYKGDYSAVIGYAINSVVRYGPSSYVALQAVGANQSPANTPASWGDLGIIPSGTSSTPTGQTPAYPLQNTTTAWSSAVTYFPGMITLNDDGYNYMCLLTNTNSQPSSINGDWIYYSTNVLNTYPVFQTGTNVVGTTVTTGVLLNNTYSYVMISFLQSPNVIYGGGTTTFTGTATLTCDELKSGAGASWIGVQMWDTATLGIGPLSLAGSNSASSFSAPSLFATPIVIEVGDGSSSYTAEVCCSISTLPGTATLPTPSSFYLGMIMTGSIQLAASATPVSSLMTGILTSTTTTGTGGSF